MFFRNHRWLGLLFVLVVALVSPLTVLGQATFNSLQEDIRFLASNSQAVLLFNVFGDNPQFTKHALHKEQIASICGGDCGGAGIGVNFGMPFGGDSSWGDADDRGMDQALAIAYQNNPGAVIQTITERDEFDIYVRFGTASGDGFTTPQSVVDFIKTVASSVGGREFYALAGPNEPDLEPWAHDSEYMVNKFGQGSGGKSSCGVYNSGDPSWAPCVAPRLADFMETVCNAKKSGEIPANVKLLTPAFNVTSPSFTPLMTELTKHINLNDACFEGMAINLYPAGKSVQDYWFEKGIDDFGVNVFVTETGPIDRVFHDVNGEDPNTGKDIEGDPGVGEEDHNSASHYITGLLGVGEPPPPAKRDVAKIRDGLANQGYQAYCATPTYTILPKFGGDIENFIDNVRAGKLAPRDVEVESAEIVDYNKASTPIFRDTERKRVLKADLEEFFGYRELGEESYGRTEVKSGAINSLLSEHQKCVKTVDTLLAQEEMCNKLQFQPEVNCALYDQSVPGTNLKIRDLLGQYKSFAGGKDRVEACHEITAKAAGVSEEFRTGMLNASLYLEKAYRIAYLVAVVEQKPNVSSTLFNFFSHSEIAQPRDEVVVLTFKIPDIGTNKGSVWTSETAISPSGKELYDRVARNEQGKRVDEVESGHTYWDDVMTLTRNVLIPRKKAEQLDLEGSEERKKLREAAASATSQNPGSLIYCLDGQAPDGLGSETCNTEDVKAVVDIINGTWNYDKERISCDKLSTENVDTIGDNAKLGPISFQNEFKPKYGEKILQNIWDINGTAQDFQSVFHVDSRLWPPKDCAVGGQGESSTGDCTTITFYLVYPMGYDVETLEYVLARTFLTKEQFAKLEEEAPIKERFNIFDDIRRLDADVETEEFTNYLACGWDDNEWVCPEEEFTATLTSDQGPALFLGARLGFWVREIQKSFNRLESLGHKYLRACRTTEEFLLDQCGGQTTDEQFNDPAYCAANPGKSNIVRGVTNRNLERFKFRKGFGGRPEDDPMVEIDDSQNTFFPTPEDPTGCTFNMSVRAVDSLTLILSGGKDIVPNNPGNILACTGKVSVAKNILIKRLPPEYGAAQKAADPNWKPDTGDEAWDTADILQTGGSSGSEINYALKFRRGYYLVNFTFKNTICFSNHHWVMQDGKELGKSGYVVDFVKPEACQAGSCIDGNVQMAMQGGGPVYGPDEDDDGQPDILYTIDSANEYLKDSYGCELNFNYSTLTYNNTCGGGRLGDCTVAEIGGNCGFWQDLIDKIKDGDTIGGQAGTDAYRSVYGRLPESAGDMSCTHEFGDSSPIFGNTLVVRSCETYSSTLDSLRVFGKIIGFRINWFMTNEPTQFEIPSRQLWDSIKAASAKHQCDPWLVLAVASSEAEEPGYLNETIPNNPQAIGMFQFTPDVWRDWTSANNPNDAQCTWRQPSTFTDANRQGLDFSNPANIPAAVDTACRMILYTGMQKYPTDRDRFVNAFTNQQNVDFGKENNFGIGWNPNSIRQAEYVYEFWEKARTAAEEGPIGQPSNFPYGQCQGGEQPSTPPGNKPPTNPNEPPEPPNSSDPELWKQFFRYTEPTQLPFQGRITLYTLSPDNHLMNEVLRNRQYGFKELSTQLIKECDLTPVGNTFEEKLASLEEQARTNGTSQAIGCMASVRLGDMYFRSRKDPSQLRTVWIKANYGPTANRPIGPIAITDVSNENHLQQQYENHGAFYMGDITHHIFRLLYDSNPAWLAPQDIMVCETREQCENVSFNR